MAIFVSIAFAAAPSTYVIFLRSRVDLAAAHDRPEDLAETRNRHRRKGPQKMRLG